MTMEVTLDNLIDFLHDFAGIKKSKKISADLRLEDDLGITGDDGYDLLEKIQEVFGLSFIDQQGSIRTAFNLKENEYLFNPEGFSLIPFHLLTQLINWLRGRPTVKDVIVPLTVGQLYQVMLRQKQNSNTPTNSNQ